MVSELKRRKFTAVFHGVDVNDNGVLDRDDLLRLAARYIEQGGWEQDSAQADGMRELFSRWWQALADAVDADKDGVISPDEFVAGLSSLDPEAFGATGPILFDVFDPSGDGLISPAEYRGLASIYGVDAAQADESFARIDLDGDGHVTREEFGVLFVEYLTSDDEGAPGNWLYGPF
jgi:Ca2+-binding EF-hand superfamily protein